MITPSLNQRIQKFYDQSTPIWLETWGEHMHHGYYGRDGKAKKERRQAQIDLISALLHWGGVTSASRILDAGCGVGGSARFLADRFQAEVLGVTLSPVQAAAAEKFSKNAGLENRVRFQVRDMMTLGPADGPFDLIWSVESAEHLADKKGLLENFYRLLAPGGRLLLATWCHRLTPPELRQRERRLLQKIYRIYHLPPMNSVENLGQLSRRAGFQNVRTDDWSDAVAPFWKEVIFSALELRNFSLLLRSSWSTIEGAWAMRYMSRGYRLGLIRFAVLQGKRARPTK